MENICKKVFLYHQFTDKCQRISTKEINLTWMLYYKAGISCYIYYYDYIHNKDEPKILDIQWHYNKLSFFQLKVFMVLLFAHSIDNIPACKSFHWLKMFHNSQKYQCL